MWEASLCQGENHAFVANLFVFFLRGALIGLAQIELFDKKLSSILLGCAEVVTAENYSWVFG